MKVSEKCGASKGMVSCRAFFLTVFVLLPFGFALLFSAQVGEDPSEPLPTPTRLSIQVAEQGSLRLTGDPPPTLVRHPSPF